VTISADDQRADGPDEAPTTPHLTVQDAEDALLEGDRTFVAGSARAAFAYPTFRRIFLGALLSHVGSWMQNVVLGAFALKITGSPVFVSMLGFAQLIPLLLLSIVGGTLADIFDRRKLLILVSIEQTGFALAIAWIASSPNPSHLGLFLCTLAIGMGQAVYAPTFSSLVPQLVDRQDLAGAVSLNSVNMNLSRVIGPAIGGAIYAAFGIAWVFVGNAISYLFIIAALLSVTLPRTQIDPTAPTGFRRLLGGFVAAREDHVVGRCLTTMTIFSLFCLCFITQMPTLASHNLGIDPKSSQYGLLYACFGLGAVIGALSIGTFLSGRSLERITRLGLAGFAVALVGFSLVRSPGVAYPAALVLGFFYFGTVTSLATVLQMRLDDRVRGRVMALWVMAFGGTVAIGALMSGPLVEASSITALMLGGAATAVLLIPYANLHDRPRPTTPLAA
jgi:predicted MFS family arabinose efflux permease